MYVEFGLGWRGRWETCCCKIKGQSLTFAAGSNRKVSRRQPLPALLRFEWEAAIQIWSNASGQFSGVRLKSFGSRPLDIGRTELDPVLTWQLKSCFQIRGLIAEIFVAF